MIIWLEKKLALALHDRQIAEHGGTTGVRDEGLLESALARPQQMYAYGEPDLADLAATLAFGLARNHPFVDGNKRTAYVSYRTFLTLNGAELVAPTEEKYLTILALAEGKLSAEDFASWLRVRIPPRSRVGVQEPRQPYRKKVRSAHPTAARSKTSRRKARRKSAAAGK